MGAFKNYHSKITKLSYNIGNVRRYLGWEKVQNVFFEINLCPPDVLELFSVLTSALPGDGEMGRGAGCLYNGLIFCTF